MAIFDTALQYVIDDTGRPELEDVIKRRIQRTVLMLHRVDFFKKDMIEQVLMFQTSQAVQIIKSSLFPRLRSIAYIRKFDPSASLSDPTVFDRAGGDFFSEVNPQMAMDGYGFDKRNKMYQAADSIKLMSSENIARVLFAWFRDPLIEPITNCDSWILQNYPNLVACYVKARVFKDIGKDEENRSAMEEYNQEFATFLANNVRLAVLQMPG